MITAIFKALKKEEMDHQIVNQIMEPQDYIWDDLWDFETQNVIPTTPKIFDQSGHNENNLQNKR